MWERLGVNLMQPWGMAFCDGRVLIPQVFRARGPLGRAIGLLGRASWPVGHALWIEPCRAVHTLGMRFPIALIFLDRDHRIVRWVPHLPPWRIASGGAAAVGVLELAAGWLAGPLVRVGARVTWSPGPAEAPAQECPPRRSS